MPLTTTAKQRARDSLQLTTGPPAPHTGSR